MTFKKSGVYFAPSKQISANQGTVLRFIQCDIVVGLATLTKGMVVLGYFDLEPFLLKGSRLNLWTMSFLAHPQIFLAGKKTMFLCPSIDCYKISIYWADLVHFHCVRCKISIIIIIIIIIIRIYSL